MDDVAVNKAATIERCIRRVREVYANDQRNLVDDATRQDSTILNIQRACESAIDLAMHAVRRHQLGIPQDSRDAFDLLATASLYPAEAAAKLRRMVGFRNVAVHDYQALNLDIVQEIIRSHLANLAAFARWAIEQKR